MNYEIGFYVMTIITMIVVIAAVLVFYLQYHKYQILDKDYDRTLDNWKEYTEKTNEQKQYFWTEIEKLKKENKELKEQNVSHETFNKSYGTPEVVDWLDQQYAREEVKRG